MPLQFEAFLPFVVIGAALYAAGPLLDHTHRFFNEGKPRRYMLDQWDQYMMERDARITGSHNIQRDPTAKDNSK